MEKICRKCETKFLTDHSSRKYCSPECSRPDKPAPVKPTDEIVHLRKAVNKLTSEIAALQDVRGLQKETIKSAFEYVAAAPQVKAVPFKRGGKSGSPVSAVLKFSDWHIGQKIRKEELSGFGEYDWTIAQERVRHIVQKFLGWVETHRETFDIPRLYVFGEGDWIHGNLHSPEANEFPAPRQTANAGILLAESLLSLAPHFDEVHLIEQGCDNHGRTSHKPVSARKAATNMSSLVYVIAEAALRAQKNIEFHRSEDMYQLVEVEKKVFLVTHGDTISGWQGTPYYGIERFRGREAQRRMRNDLGFDYISMAHWHVPSIIGGNIYVNGSLSGTSEYDHSCSRHAGPAQVSFLVHPKYGPFDWTAWQPTK